LGVQDWFPFQVPIVSPCLVTYVEFLNPSKQNQQKKLKLLMNLEGGLWETKAPWITSRNRANIGREVERDVKKGNKWKIIQFIYQMAQVQEGKIEL
jgi:hypothetical protein